MYIFDYMIANPISYIIDIFVYPRDRLENFKLARKTKYCSISDQKWKFKTFFLTFKKWKLETLFWHIVNSSLYLYVHMPADIIKDLIL